MTVSSDTRPTGTALAGKAFGSAAEAWTKMKPLVVSAAVASAILGLVFTLAKIGLGASPQIQTGNPWLAILQTPLQAAIDAPLAVAVHRLILKGEVTPGIISLSRPYHWLFFAWMCVIAFAEIALAGGTFLAAGPLLAVIVIIGCAVFFIKAALVFPAIAIEAPSSGWRDRLQTSWRQMNGNSWLFFRAILLTILPLVCAIVLVGIGLALAALIVSIVVMLPMVWIVVTQAILAGIGQPAGVMLAAAVASWLYLWVIENPAAQAQSAQTATSTVT